MRRAYPLSPLQCQVARTYLGWTQTDLAKTASVGRSTICCFEEGRGVRFDSATKLAAAFEAHGIEFTEGEGVRRRNMAGSVYHGYGAADIFYDDLLKTALEGGEIACMAKSQDALFQICGDDGIERLADLGQKTKVRCLITEALTLSVPISTVQFRASPTRIVNTNASFGYGNKFAVVLRESRTAFVYCVFNASQAAQDYRMDFLSVWEDSVPLPTQQELRDRLYKVAAH